jgi:hypothetical protein
MIHTDFLVGKSEVIREETNWKTYVKTDLKSHRPNDGGSTHL